eukprot:CAMPEP_0118686872 /NCGR_PEP_ID=MMETSP0800-20121206/8059_1 /TAXON_ID=210618 ORGANISM="Striatella unipunctata, Strain CCMP2910" /NCGR_SAMPLE_ID=MMETSP0800 /ASSEMBLY_ACC=CAM_ASM_000638 /LENGTH=779 /DNA_ID=CAMNT_0006583975 /DNA_START=91 /DNA_END=2430 /DNA_ORIENTATION=+
MLDCCAVPQSQQQHQQSRFDLLEGVGVLFRSCKTCAVWSTTSHQDDVDSCYVFAGGGGANVTLYDLRMFDNTAADSKVVQYYRPSVIPFRASVSVSGLDISRDKKELLVSYENDQIYSFPISNMPPMQQQQQQQQQEEEEEEERVHFEFKSYGGHLNRFTFLKNARYAGPQDNYICTGSDSGHAWIYERSTGSVVSLLKADNSTCNGVVPHPFLPFFITYGIDSTAKLWRATLPVDQNVDDSRRGRFAAYVKQPYHKSDIARSWKYVQKVLNDLDSNNGIATDRYILPDDIQLENGPHDETGFLGGIMRGFLPRHLSRHNRRRLIRNDLHNLSDLLCYNYSHCAFALYEDEPVKSGLKPLKERMAGMRLRNEGEQRGLDWRLDLPFLQKSNDHNSLPCFHVCDLLPDHAGDWIPYDLPLTKTFSAGPPFEFHLDYVSFYHKYFVPMLHRYEAQDDNVCPEEFKHLSLLLKERLDCKNNTTDKKKKTEEVDDNDEDENIKDTGGGEQQEEEWTAQRKHEEGWKMLYEAVCVLKAGGNAALQANEVSLAARRYDKALRYCAVAFMEYSTEKMGFLSRSRYCWEKTWTPMLKAMISVRLNLSLALMKQPIDDFAAAETQATLACKELLPFKEKHEEARELFAKAHFRSGTAKHALGDYEGAVRCFDLSIKETNKNNGSNSNDVVVLRRLQEAKREYAREKRLRRKKYKRMFAEQHAQDCNNNNNNTTNNSNNQEDEEVEDQQKKQQGVAAAAATAAGGGSPGGDESIKENDEEEQKTKKGKL